MKHVANLLVILAVLTLELACGTNSHTLPPSADPDARDGGSPSELVGSEVVLAGRTVRVEIADDWETRGRGLSGRSELGADEGMIFLYPRADIRNFWMKGCRIGLDILFLDDEGRILNVASLDPPEREDVEDPIPSASSIAPARMVLEVKKGWSEEHGIKAGELVRLSKTVRARLQGLRERD